MELHKRDLPAHGGLVAWCRCRRDAGFRHPEDGGYVFRAPDIAQRFDGLICGNTVCHEQSSSPRRPGGEVADAA